MTTFHSGVYLVLVLLKLAVPIVSQTPPTGNSHVTFGDVASCVQPPSGNCGSFTISPSDVTTSLVGFTTANGGTLTTSTVNYYGDWWNTNVGTNTAVASTFCASGNPATASVQNYNGITHTQGSDAYTLTGYSVANHDMENYCSAAGGNTPPLMTSSFTTSSTSSSIPQSVGTGNRADISNSVGLAVNSVTIFSPYTGIGTVAPYDETLDTCRGHPANSQYHYHGWTSCLHGDTFNAATTTHSKIFGWAFDGFPIYGPFGYTDGNDAASAVTRVTGGYSCTVSSVACTDDQKKTAANWALSASTGMLDDCNGRWTKTPEFPNGMYVYVLNVDASGSIEFPGVPYCKQSATTASSASPTASPSPGTSPASSPTASPSTSSSPSPSPVSSTSHVAPCLWGSILVLFSLVCVM